MVLSRAIIITATDVVASTSTPSSDTGDVSCADDVELGTWSWEKIVCGLVTNFSCRLSKDRDKFHQIRAE